MSKWIVMLLMVGANVGPAISQTSDKLVAAPVTENQVSGATVRRVSEHKDRITWTCPKKLNLS